MKSDPVRTEIAMHGFAVFAICGSLGVASPLHVCLFGFSRILFGFTVTDDAGPQARVGDLSDMI